MFSDGIPAQGPELRAVHRDHGVSHSQSESEPQTGKEGEAEGGEEGPEGGGGKLGVCRNYKKSEKKKFAVFKFPQRNPGSEQAQHFSLSAVSPPPDLTL